MIVLSLFITLSHESLEDIHFGIGPAINLNNPFSMYQLPGLHFCDILYPISVENNFFSRKALINFSSKLYQEQNSIDIMHCSMIFQTKEQ